MESIKIEIGDLFEFLNLNNDKYDETQYSEKHIYVKTDKGDLTPILGYVKKQDKPIYKCMFETNETIRVADTHIFRTNNEEIFAKDSKGKLLDTLEGQVRCTDVTYDGVEDVYDISIEFPHWYTHDEDFANGLISHNTLHMASWATNAFINGFNVAIFSMEDGELGYASRLDANLMNTNLAYMKEKALAMNTTFESVITENVGKIKIKEYPTGMPTVNNFRAVLQDWKIKEGFIPDIIFVDYINIMQSVKGSSNGYENGKYVAEDIRGLGVELNIPIVTATQSRRDAFSSDSLGMADTAESIGVPQTADTMIGIVANEDVPDKQFISILKSRSIDKNKIGTTAVNVDIEHQRVTEITDGRSKRMATDVKKTLHQMETFVETAETLTLNTNSDLTSMFNTPI